MTAEEAPSGRETTTSLQLGLLTARLIATEAEAVELRAELDQTSRGLIAVHTELSDQHEQLERARAEAEQANQAKATFLANMSHEIRSPLNAVTGFTSLLLVTDLSPEQTEYADTIRSACDHLRDLVDDILDLSKIESGHLELEAIPFDVLTCVEDAVGIVAPSAAEKTLALATLVGPDVPGSVLGDPFRLRQILVNLLANAVKFTLAGSVTVEVAATSPEPATALGGGGLQRLAFRVRDTGIGISGDAVERLFEPFTQADASTTRTFGGTGLGLKICRELAERMGGGLTVESIEGAGSTFTCTIAVRPVQPAQPEPVPDTPLAGTQVLLVHGTAVVAEAVRRHLVGWGADVVNAASATDAARRAGEWASAAVALLDAPDPDALARSAEHLTRVRPGLPIVALRPLGSGQPLAGAVDGVRAVVSTPVRRSHLHDAVLGALGRLPDAPARTGPGGPQPEAGTLRILLAEDNPLNQRAATLMLGRLGHRTDMVGDGERAVAAIHSGDYDLVLMDVQMPGIDGIEATRRARSHPPGRRPRIVAVTASATPEVRQACLDAGMDDFLAKPFSLADLTRVVEATPHRPRPRPAAVGGPDRGAPPASSARTRRVLYVDDNPMLITLVERILAREPDLIVLTADRGEQALALAATAHPDLILFDLNLPDMTGDVLLRRLRADSATRSIPAVVVSGDTDPATIERLITLGAVDYLTKPFDAARLRGTLAAVLHAAEPTAPAAP